MTLEPAGPHWQVPVQRGLHTALESCGGELLTLALACTFLVKVQYQVVPRVWNQLCCSDTQIPHVTKGLDYDLSSKLLCWHQRGKGKRWSLTSWRLAGIRWEWMPVFSQAQSRGRERQFVSNPAWLYLLLPCWSWVRVQRCNGRISGFQ